MAGFKEYQMLFQLNASTGSGFSATFASGASSISSLQDKINSLNKTSSDISSYQKQQAAIDKTKAKIDLYQTQLTNLQNATASTSKEEAELANAIAAKEKQLTDVTNKLDQQNEALSETGQALREAGVDTNNLAEESEKLKAEAADVARAQKEEAEAAQEAGQSLRDAAQGAAAALEAAGIIEGLKAVYSALSDCSQVAAEFESSMAGVKRTVGGSDQFINELGDSFQQLSTEIPITATELANIATTAGQLGIAQDNVEVFSTVMAKLATTTDLTADNAATMLAQFSNITGVTDYERLGSTVAALGDSTATTASKVVDMSQGMAAAASIAGMSSTDILAISAAVGSLGIEAAAGSTSMSQLITKLYKATETGDQLEDIAAVAGMTGEQFKTAWGTDAVGAMDAFIQGLNNVEQNGASAVVVLDQLGINNVRQTKAILGLASAGDLLSNTISVANNAWNQNTALTEKAGVMYGTTEAKLTMMGNAANNVKIAVGDALNPALGAVSESITKLLQPIAEWIAANPAIVQGLTVFVGALGVTAAGIVGFTAVTKLATAAAALFTASLPIGWILGIAGAIGAVVAAISALTGGSQEVTKSFQEMDQEYDSLMDQFGESKKVLELVDDYRELGKETENLQQLMEGGFNISVTAKKDDTKIAPEAFLSSTEVQLTASQVSSLLAEGFMKPGDKGITISAAQTANLVANGFLDPKDKGITITAKQTAELLESGFLKKGDKGITLTAKQAKTLEAQGFMDPKAGGIVLTATQKKNLKNAGFMDPDDEAITLTAKQSKELYSKGFLAPDDEGITLSAGQTRELVAEGFLKPDDKGITLSAEQTKNLVASGFLDPKTGSVVKIDATTGKKIQASALMEETIVTITGKADKENSKLTAADFGVSDQTLKYIATMDETSVQEVREKAASLQDQVIIAGSELNSAKTQLTTALREATFLEEKIAGTKKKSDKTALQQQLEELNASIAEQQDNVDNLQLKYDSLTGEYNIVSTAAEELSGKEAALLAIKQQLSGVATDVAEASGEQASAYNEEADAAERVAKARAEDAQNAMYASIIEQSSAYVQSLNDEVVAAENRNKVQEKQARIQAQITDNTKNNGEGIKAQLTEVEGLYNEWALVGGMMDDMPEGLSDGRKALQEIIQAATGMTPELESIIGAGETWIDEVIEGTDELRQSYTVAQKEAEGYQAQIEAADKIQQDFINNLVDGIENGSIESLDDLRSKLEETFSDTENGAEIVNGIMTEVETQINEITEAKNREKEVTEDLGGTEVSTAEVITSKIEALGEAWTEAYDAAYSSMSGQFKLFESAKDKIDKMHKGWEGGTDGMKAGIDSQTQYVQEYTKNFEEAKAKLEASGASAETTKAILSSLSDGSAESAAALESIANGEKEDAKDLADAYEALEAAKQDFSADVAEMKTDFSTQMNALATELATVVAGMDKSSEASTAATNTLNAYVNASNGYASKAATKWGAVAAAAVRAMNAELAKIKNPKDKFASGTASAPRGLAIVGEEGPELVMFNGGEKVLNARETESFAKQNVESAQAAGKSISANGGNYSIDFSPQFNITGNANAAEVRAVLEEQTANLREQVESVINDLITDQKRRNYTS